MQPQEVQEHLFPKLPLDVKASVRPKKHSFPLVNHNYRPCLGWVVICGKLLPQAWFVGDRHLHSDQHGNNTLVGKVVR